MPERSAVTSPAREWNAPHASPFGRAMDAVVYAADSPSGGISASGHNWYDVTFTVHDGYARQAGEARVEQDLQGLLRVLFARGMAEYRRVLGSTTTSTSVPMTERRRAWQQERDAMAVEGLSDGGAVRISAVGMGHWAVELRPGTCAALDDAALAAALTQAGARLGEQWVTSLRALNRKHFFGKRS